MSKLREWISKLQVAMITLYLSQIQRWARRRDGQGVEMGDAGVSRQFRFKVSSVYRIDVEVARDAPTISKLQVATDT
jgi:hypothetical protein